MSGTEIGMFVFLAALATAIFLRSVYRLFAIMCLGRWENRFDHLIARCAGTILYGFGQRRVISERFGLNHFFIFWGFLCLLLINTEFLVAGVFPDFSIQFIGAVPYGLLLLLADLMSVVVLVTILIATVRRTFFRPAHIAATLDAYVILSLIAVLMVAYFGLNACEIAAGKKSGDWMWVSQQLSTVVPVVDHPDLVYTLSRTFWWIHALVLLFFLTYLPMGKHLHIITAIPNVFFRSLSFVSTVPRLVFRRGQRFGVSKVYQFTWKDLLDFYACTECGRCEAHCPAHLTGKPLNPKQVIHAGKLNLLTNGESVLSARPIDTLASASDDTPTRTELIGGGDKSISLDAIWACTTCGACMEKCPVFIEHVPKLIGMRRHLVMEKAEFPEQLISLFENTEQRSNPWGIAPSDRGKWARDQEVKLIVDDVAVEYLFFVGCAGAFDARNRQTSMALAKIFNAAGLSWGIFGNNEKCCGDSLRRLGNEYVFDQIARENIALFQKHGITKIITSCPHCFSTLRNDYRQFGAELQVFHHTQIIADLLQQEKLRLLKSTDERVVFHDSCYLGRYNEVYDAPRKLLTAACGGTAPLEMPRCRQESFCCGAGGGRMWMEEDIGKNIYLERTGEALEQDPETIAVACPYCMTMFDDGIKEEEVGTRVQVKDVAEIIAQVMK